MATENKFEKLEKILGGVKKSNWLEEAKVRQANKAGMKTNQMVALYILRTLRKQKLTQRDLADRLGVTAQQVNKWVKGSENISIANVERIQKALGVRIMELREPEPEVCMKMVMEPKVDFYHLREHLIIFDNFKQSIINPLQMLQNYQTIKYIKCINAFEPYENKKDKSYGS